MNNQEVQSYFSKEVTFQIDGRQLEKITESVYGKRIEIIESDNDTTHSYKVETGLADYEQEKLDTAIEEGILECYEYNVILNDLCTKGLIEPGQYFVRVSW